MHGKGKGALRRYGRPPPAPDEEKRSITKMPQTVSGAKRLFSGSGKSKAVFLRQIQRFAVFTGFTRIPDKKKITFVGVHGETGLPGQMAGKIIFSVKYLFGRDGQPLFHRRQGNVFRQKAARSRDNAGVFPGGVVKTRQIKSGH